MADSKADADAASADAFDVSRQQVRDTAKWIVTGVFAALAALLGSIGFSHLGDVFAGGGHALRMVFAILGGAVCLTGMLLLATDALHVLSIDLHSPGEYATAAETPRPLGKSIARFFRASEGYGESQPIEYAAIRARVERTYAGDWPDDVRDFAGLLALETAIGDAPQAQPLTAASLTLTIDATTGKLVAQGGGGTLDLAQADRLEIGIADGKLVRFGPVPLVRYSIDAALQPVLDPAGPFHADSDRLDRLATQIYASLGLRRSRSRSRS